MICFATLFISQLRELTIDKLLEMRLAPRLAQELRRETLDADMYDYFKWRISLEPVEGRPDLMRMYSVRDYAISNLTYRVRNLTIFHSEEMLAAMHQDTIPGYRTVTFAVDSLEDSNEQEPVTFDRKSLEDGASRFLGRPIEIERERWAVRLQYQLELQPRSCFFAIVASETCVHSDGTEPFICDRPSTSLEITVSHPQDTEIGVFELNNSNGKTIKPRIGPPAGPAGRIEETWIFRRGFFPGHGIQLYWAPVNSILESNHAELE